MKIRSIGVRLTAWYLGMMVVGLSLFGAGSWYAMRASAFNTIDEELEDRIRGVKKFMDVQIASLSPVEIQDEFREHSVLGPGGDLFQVCDAKGQWLYRSAPLENSQVPIRLPDELRPEPAYESRDVQGIPIRFASASVVVNGSPYSVQVAVPLHEFYEALERFRFLLWLSVPVLLILATTGGYWISRQALQPVDRITRTADSISIHNLSERLDVSHTGDELQRLSETLNRMLARLHDAVQRMTQFTADASHELRAPIAVIRTTAELAVKGGRTAPEYHEDMEQILAESERTSRLIDTLLMLARADAGEYGFYTELTDLGVVVRDVVEQCGSLALAKDIELSFNNHAAHPIINADPEAMRRLAFNLIDNAIKYTREGGRVSVRLFTSYKHAVLEVEDSGIGIAADDQAHIFDRFWRADKVRSRGMGGVGLGLSIAKWIVEGHGGLIEVKSQLGRGSTFEVRLPLVEG